MKKAWEKKNRASYKLDDFVLQKAEDQLIVPHSWKSKHAQTLYTEQ